MKGRHFFFDAEVITVAETWLDGQTSEFFFKWLAKLKSLVAVVWFLPGRVKDLSAPRYCSNERDRSSESQLFLKLSIGRVKSFMLVEF